MRCLPLYKLHEKKLTLIKEDKIQIEKDLQTITEMNLEKIFDLEFVSTEFTLDNFRIDSLAFDNQTNSFVIIEYKRDKSSSIVDQGYTYLSLLLNNKADFVLEYFERTGKSLKKSDVDWSQSRVLFVAPAFTTYQKEAIGFRDLPIELWKVDLYENKTIAYTRIETKSRASISEVKKDTKIKRIATEVKEYTLDLHLKWPETKELYEKFKEQLMQRFEDTTVRINKQYIAFISEETNKSIVEIVTLKKGLKLYLRPLINEFSGSQLELNDCSNMGHWTTGNTFFMVSKPKEILPAIDLIQQAKDLE